MATTTTYVMELAVLDYFRSVGSRKSRSLTAVANSLEEEWRHKFVNDRVYHQRVLKWIKLLEERGQLAPVICYGSNGNRIQKWMYVSDAGAKASSSGISSHSEERHSDIKRALMYFLCSSGENGYSSDRCVFAVRHLLQYPENHYDFGQAYRRVEGILHSWESAKMPKDPWVSLTVEYDVKLWTLTSKGKDEVRRKEYDLPLSGWETQSDLNFIYSICVEMIYTSCFFFFFFYMYVSFCRILNDRYTI